MPQKVCGGKILHVMTYAIFPEMLEHIHFWFFSRFQIDQLFSRNAFLCSKFLISHFPIFRIRWEKWGYLNEKKARDQFQDGESTEIE